MHTFKLKFPLGSLHEIRHAGATSRTLFSAELIGLLRTHPVLKALVERNRNQAETSSLLLDRTAKGMGHSKAINTKVYTYGTSHLESIMDRFESFMIHRLLERIDAV